MGYKSGTVAQGLVPGKVPALRATDTPQHIGLSHGLEHATGKR